MVKAHRPRYTSWAPSNRPPSHCRSSLNPDSQDQVGVFGLGADPDWSLGLGYNHLKQEIGC